MAGNAFRRCERDTDGSVIGAAITPRRAASAPNTSCHTTSCYTLSRRRRKAARQQLRLPPVSSHAPVRPEPQRKRWCPYAVFLTVEMCSPPNWMWGSHFRLQYATRWERGGEHLLAAPLRSVRAAAPQTHRSLTPITVCVFASPRLRRFWCFLDTK